jgi:hypothetical protein
LGAAVLPPPSTRTFAPPPCTVTPWGETTTPWAKAATAKAPRAEAKPAAKNRLNLNKAHSKQLKNRQSLTTADPESDETSGPGAANLLPNT